MGTKYKGSKKEKAALDAFINLMRCANSLGSRLSNSYMDHNLTDSQFGVLEAIFHLGPLCQKELAGKLLVTNGNMTMVIDNLEKGGLVERIRNKEDRRYFSINLTKNGRNLIQKIFPKHVESIVEEFGSLTQTEQMQLRELCRKLGKK
ncbi:MAG: MarR family winged helix-turn-helix transcriptional regulator [Thermodesulfobacteriota bacterium]